MSETAFPSLPDGMTHRAPTLDDAEAMAELHNSVHLHETGIPYESAEGNRRSLQDPDCDIARDFRLIFDGDRMVGSIELFTRSPYDRISVEGSVRPQDRGRGIGSFLLGWAMRRAKEKAAEHPTDGSPILQSFINEGEAGASARAFFEQHGWEPERWFHHMEMELSDEVPPLPLPDGITIRRAQPGEEWAIGQASDEAFQDHFGYSPNTEEGWRHHMVDRPDFDLNLWLVAVTDDGTIAGDCLNFINDERGETRGLIDDVAVRRPWRRQGLGAALVAAGLRAIQERGVAVADLFVDAQNPTGALGVYERAGMKVARSFVDYSKRLS